MTIRPTFISIWGYRLIRYIYGGLFLYAGISKLLDPQSFSVIIEAFGLVPVGWTVPIALGLPYLEIAAGLGILLDVRGSLMITTGLLAFFMAILGYGIWLGIDIDCGCFGPSDPEARAYSGLRPAFYRDLVMLAGISSLYFCRYIHSSKPFEWKTFL